jgi:hypothetical protein
MQQYHQYVTIFKNILNRYCCWYCYVAIVQYITIQMNLNNIVMYSHIVEYCSVLSCFIYNIQGVRDWFADVVRTVTIPFF